jgi:DnaK suppressor protein
MTDTELEQHVERLRAQRAALLAEGRVGVKVEEADPVASKQDEDAAPYVEMGQAIASSRNRERAQRLALIDQALRLAERSPEDVGICEVCQEEIPPRRMELMPWARRCAPCQGRAEVKGPAVRRKVTDYR